MGIRGAAYGLVVGALAGAIIGIGLFVIGAIYGIPIGAFVGLFAGCFNGIFLGTVTVIFFNPLTDEKAIKKYRFISRIVGTLGSAVFTSVIALIVLEPRNSAGTQFFVIIPAVAAMLLSLRIVPKIIDPYIRTQTGQEQYLAHSDDSLRTGDHQTVE